MSRILSAVITLILIGFIALLAWPEASYERYEPDAAYMAQVESFDIPAMPADWTQKLFEAEDGTLLRWGETGNRNSAKATIIWVPGYTATIDMYGEHFDRLAREGYHVMAIDMRGQGLSERDRPDQPEKLHVEDFSVYSDDLAAFVSKEAPEDRLLIPMAMSFGGHVALRTAINDPELFDGLYLVAPAIAPKMGANPDATRGFMALMRILGKERRYMPGQTNWHVTMPDMTVAGPEYCASDPKRLHMRDVLFAQRPEQRVGGVTAAWGSAFLKSADWLAASGRYDRLDIPIVMVMAELEDFVENDVITAACSDFLNCQTLPIPGTGHCLTQETDDVLNTMFEGLDALVATLVSPGDLYPDLTLEE